MQKQAGEIPQASESKSIANTENVQSVGEARAVLPAPPGSNGPAGFTEMASENSRVKQLKAYQQMADRSMLGKNIPKPASPLPKTTAPVQRVKLDLTDNFGTQLDTEYMMLLHNYVVTAMINDDNDALETLLEEVEAKDKSKLDEVKRDIDAQRILRRSRLMHLASVNGSSGDAKAAATASGPRSVEATSAPAPSSATLPATVHNEAQPHEQPHADQTAAERFGGAVASVAVSSPPPPAAAAAPKGYKVSAKEVSALAKKLEAPGASIESLARWVPTGNKAMFNAFTASTEAFEAWEALTCTAGEFMDWMTSERSSDYQECAVQKVRLDRLRARASSAAAAPAKTAKVTTLNTLTRVEAYWKSQGNETATSKSGGGMLLLKSLTYDVGGKQVKAHISLPPNDDGTFSEGHLKIEEGEFLNQYFFSVSAGGAVAKITNSQTVPTESPGTWASLPGAVWTSVKAEVEKLATGKLS